MSALWRYSRVLQRRLLGSRLVPTVVNGVPFVKNVTT